MPPDLQTRPRERGDAVPLSCETITGASQGLDPKPQDVAANSRSADRMTEELQAMVSDSTAQRADRELGRFLHPPLSPSRRTSVTIRSSKPTRLDLKLVRAMRKALRWEMTWEWDPCAAGLPPHPRRAVLRGRTRFISPRITMAPTRPSAASFPRRRRLRRMLAKCSP